MLEIPLGQGLGRKRQRLDTSEERALAQQAQNLLQTAKNLAKAERILAGKKADVETTRANLMRQYPGLNPRRSED